MFEIIFGRTAKEELQALKTVDLVRVFDEIDEHLREMPTVPTKRRKLLAGLVPNFEHELPVWELKIGDFRVFYDVDENARAVHIRAIRFKGRSTTREIT